MPAELEHCLMCKYTMLHTNHMYAFCLVQSGTSRGIGLGKEEEEQLRAFIVSMVSDPLVLVIKLADRLHNMRTVFALKKDKQKAVATETQQVWCSLAERLGMMALKVKPCPDQKRQAVPHCFIELQPAYTSESDTLKAWNASLVS